MEYHAEDLPGALPPTGFFDPWLIAANRTPKEVKKLREAELKHGRLAMLATVGILVQERWAPLFGGKVSGPAIYHFQQINHMAPWFWLFAVFGIGLVEARNIARGWESPQETRKKPSGLAELKDDYIPGDLGFDPLNLMPTDPTAFRNMRTKELQNGRLAMIAVAGMVAQELVNGKPIFENLGWV